MKVLLQRVKWAKVEVDSKLVGRIDHGLVLFVGFTEGDDKAKIDYIVKKILNIRVFNDEQGIMNVNIQDINGSVLSVSQFTLYADVTNGNRPSYVKALDKRKAVLLYNYFNNKLKESINVASGTFGEDMKVSLLNDGPVTILLER